MQASIQLQWVPLEENSFLIGYKKHKMRIDDSAPKSRPPNLKFVFTSPRHTGMNLNKVRDRIMRI